MKRLIIVGLISLASTVAVAGDEEPSVTNFNYGPYVGIHGGVAIPGGNNGGNFKTGPDVGSQAGFQIGSLRLEGAFTYLSNTLSFNDGIALRMTTLMGNGYYDFQVRPFFAPYVGFGIGWLHAWGVNVPFTINPPEDNEFAYQVMGGVRFHATHHFIIDLGYHRLGWTDGNGAQNLVELGLNYAF